MSHALTLFIAVFFASTSGIWIKLAHADPSVIAFYRVLFAFILFFPSVWNGLRAKRMTLAQLGWSLLAGAVFGAHIIVWIASVQQTTVANAAICFAINPVITAVLGHYFFGERADRLLMVSILLGFAGVMAIGWTDFSLSGRFWFGDVAAFFSGVIFTLYLLIGKKVRTASAGPTSRYYMGVLYFGAALVTGLLATAQQLPFSGFDLQTWFAFLGLTLCPTILGHGLFNYLVKYLRASVISTATLAEPLFAGVMAYFLYGEKFTFGTIVGYVLITSGVLFLTTSMRQRRESSSVVTENP